MPLLIMMRQSRGGKERYRCSSSLRAVATSAVLPHPLRCVKFLSTCSAIPHEVSLSGCPIDREPLILVAVMAVCGAQLLAGFQ